MGLHLKQTATSGFNNPAAAAETAVYTTPVLPAVGPAEAPGVTPVGISGTVNLTPGTGATGATIRVRQGNGTGGTLVSNASPVHTVAAAAPQSISFGATDATGYLQGGGQYTITVQMTGASAPTAINLVDAEVLV